MANQDFLTINGTQVMPPLSPSGADVAIDHCRVFARGSCPELHFSTILGKLTTLPDPWSGQTVSWLHGATLGTATSYFGGDVVSYADTWNAQWGWVRQYRALGIEHRCDWVPVTDANTLSDVAQYDLPSNNPAVILAREGRTIGQCILDLLSMSENVAALAGQGVGNFTSSGSGGIATANLTGSDMGLSGYYGVNSLTVVQGGVGYTTAPTIVLAGGGGYGATATATVSGGAITSFTVTAAGQNYLTAPQVIISTLPSVTIADLVPLILQPPTGSPSTPGSYVGIIPPYPVSFAGERILQSIDGILKANHPNYWTHIDPAGNLRFFDQRIFSTNTVTLNNPGDPRWMVPELTRDHGDCYSQLIVRGGLDVSGVTLSTQQFPGSSFVSTWPQGTDSSTSTSVPNGGLLEDFAYGSYTTNQAACNAWDATSPPGAAFQQLSLQGGQIQGSISSMTTTSVVVNVPTGVSWSTNQLDQTITGLHAMIVVFSDIIAGVTQSFTARVTANTAGSSGGTSTLSVDQTFPGVTYNSYYLYVLSTSGNIVWRRYYVVNRTIAAQMQQSFPYPFAYRNSDGTAAMLTTAPICVVEWGSGGYSWSGNVGISLDPVGGVITTMQPTAIVNGNSVTKPSNVTVIIPVANGDLQVIAPATGYAGTLYTVEGIARTKTITVREWTDYGQTVNLQVYCNEQFDALKDVVVEGRLPYLGLPTTYLAPGNAVSITGSSFTTGYESLALPVASVEVEFQWGQAGTSYLTQLGLSNRKARYSAAVFMRPPVTGQQFGASSEQANVINAAWSRIQPEQEQLDHEPSEQSRREPKEEQQPEAEQPEQEQLEAPPEDQEPIA